MNEAYWFENFTLRKLQIKELCRASDTNLKMYLKEEIKVTLSQAYEYTTFVTFVHISVYMFHTRLLIFLLRLLFT